MGGSCRQTARAGGLSQVLLLQLLQHAVQLLVPSVTEHGLLVLLVRQPTSGTGYHTTDADVRRLYDMVKEKLLAIR